MEHITEFVDERQKSWCIHCTRPLVTVETNRDHVPTKSLLHKPYPRNLPVVEVCMECNNGFSSDEQYFVAFLSAVMTGSTDPDSQYHPGAARLFKTKPLLRSRIEKSAQDLLPLHGERVTVWEPERERVERVVLKNARGHAFFEYGEPMLEKPTHVWFVPLITLAPAERDAFENPPDSGGYPEVGSRMMTRVFTGKDLHGPWVNVQDGVYRYSVTQPGNLMVRSVIFEYLATEVYWE
jgi:hypothetical protein